MSYSQFAASTQFFLYGTRHFNQTGYLKHLKEYKEYTSDPLYEKPTEVPSSALADTAGAESSLDGRVFIVTGANSGIGKEISKSLAARGATLYMLCRNPERAEKARSEIVEETKNTEVHVLQGDCGLESGVRGAWAQFVKQSGAGEAPKLDGLVCNAGVLLNERKLTSEGIETTLACHLLFGSYLLGCLAMPSLEASNGRLVFLTSGGLYNTAFPGWDVAASLKGTYDGNLAYAYAKRGQLLLAEQWAVKFPKVKVVAAHPGWTLTDAVDAAYGSTKKYLEPMRTPWQGAEGIAWLMRCPVEQLESGALYLDRKPQVKHMAGPFFTEGSFTKNSSGEIAAMMVDLDNWANGRRPVKEQLEEFEASKAAVATAAKAPCTALDRPIDIKKFMGKWYVIAHIPTFVDKGTANNTEDYVWDEEKKRVNVTFSYSNKALTKTSTITQVATPVTENQTEWKVALKVAFIPLTLPYLIVDCAEDYSTCIVGDPKRSFLYIMARTSTLSDAELNVLTAKSMRAGYSNEKLVRVPQTWDDDKK